ncbi:MAG: putative amidoligase domain-containing protein [Promethearchaeota archaeon]
MKEIEIYNDKIFKEDIESVKVCPLLGKIKNYYAHREFRPVPNSAFFYCFFPHNLFVYNEIDRLFIETKFGNYDGMFFDKGFEYENRQDGVKGISIYVKDLENQYRWIGAYLPKSNILVATDWTHSIATVSMIIYILPELKKILRKRPVGEKKENYSIKIGIDAEFECINYKGALYTAEELGYDTTTDEIGCDGSGEQLEIRPSASENVDKLINNIRQLLMNFNYESYDNFRLSISGHYLPLGAHIHFGIPEKFQFKEIYRKIVQVLDDFIGIPLTRLNGKARGSYSGLGHYRTKPWGFEYRTVPSGYLYEPEFARIVLKLAKGIVEYILNKKKIKYEFKYNSIFIDKKYYLKFINEVEYLYFWNSINNLKYKIFDSDYTPINYKRWGINPDTNILIYFKDTWNNDIKEDLRKILSRIFKYKYKDKDLEYPIILKLFGFAEYRGLVSNLKIADWQIIDWSIGDVGLPYKFRVNKQCYFKYKKDVIKTIISYLERW